jgi:hypothetical protein
VHASSFPTIIITKNMDMKLGMILISSLKQVRSNMVLAW